MNTISNNQPKAAKKLSLNKETLRSLSATQPMFGAFGPTADCSIGGTCTTCAC